MNSDDEFFLTTIDRKIFQKTSREIKAGAAHLYMEGVVAEDYREQIRCIKACPPDSHHFQFALSRLCQAELCMILRVLHPSIHTKICAQKITGSSRRRAVVKGPFASYGVAGATTLKPVICTKTEYKY